jgi:hypothetical protein
MLQTAMEGETAARAAPLSIRSRWPRPISLAHDPNDHHLRGRIFGPIPASNPAPDDVGRRRVGVDFELNVGKVERVPKRARWLLRRQRELKKLTVVPRSCSATRRDVFVALCLSGGP